MLFPQLTVDEFRAFENLPQSVLPLKCVTSFGELQGISLAIRIDMHSCLCLLLNHIILTVKAALLCVTSQSELSINDQILQSSVIRTGASSHLLSPWLMT